MKNQKIQKKRSGFTLIELVIVIVILGILAGIAALSFSNVTESSRDGVAKSNGRTIKSAILVYQIDHNGTMPGAFSFAVPAGGGNPAEGGVAGDMKKYLEKDAYSGPNGYTYEWTPTPGAGGAPATTGTLKVTGGGLGTSGFEITVGN